MKAEEWTNKEMKTEELKNQVNERINILKDKKTKETNMVYILNIAYFLISILFIYATTICVSNFCFTLDDRLYYAVTGSQFISSSIICLLGYNYYESGFIKQHIKKIEKIKIEIKELRSIDNPDSFRRLVKKEF